MRAVCVIAALGAFLVACPQIVRAADDEVVYNIGVVDKQPLRRGRTATPSMPSEIIKRGTGCWAGVQWIVGKDGNVETADAIYWSDEGFKTSCVEAVLKWKFSPAMKDGAPVKCRIAAPFVGNPDIKVMEAPLDAKSFVMASGLKPYPDFPKEVLSKANSATVEFLVGADGTVSKIKTKSTTDPTFSKAIEEAVAKWRYTPAQKDKQPVSCPMSVTFKITLSKSKK